MESISWGTDGFKGLKDHYEDRTDACFLGGLGHFFAMYDGHGGPNCSDFLKEELSASADLRAVERRTASW